jgi:hypothetical protein
MIRYHLERKYDSMTFSVKPSSANWALLRERWSMLRMEAPIEQPIQATSLGLKLQETNPD